MEKTLDSLALNLCGCSKMLLYAFATLQPNRVEKRNG